MSAGDLLAVGFSLGILTAEGARLIRGARMDSGKVLCGFGVHRWRMGRGWAEPDGLFCTRCYETLASADTHPKDGDVQQAPLVSGAVPLAADAHTQSPKGEPNDT